MLQTVIAERLTHSFVSSNEWQPQISLSQRSLIQFGYPGNMEWARRFEHWSLSSGCVVDQIYPPLVYHH